MGKYEALSQFLRQVNGAIRRMRFSEIERILGFKLPKSAYKHEAWWSNNDTGHSHARAWLELGWRTEAVDLTKRQVTFRRSLADRPPQDNDPWGCMAGTITISPDTDLTAPTDDKWNAEEGRLVND